MPTDRTTYMKTYRAEARRSGMRRVSVTLTPAEYARLGDSATKHGERVTSHLKTQALAALDRRYLVPADLAERLDSLLSVMRGIGNNLNQLARHSNEMRYFLDTEDVRLKLRRLEDAVRDFVEKPAEEGG